MKKKFDIENGTLRMKIANEREKKQFEQQEHCIKYKGHTFRLNGFTVVKKKEKVVCAFKAKDENKIFIAYFDDNAKDIRGVYDKLIKRVRSAGYEFRDLREIWDKILLQLQETKKTPKKAIRSINAKGG
jgi:hypothetical protein